MHGLVCARLHFHRMVLAHWGTLELGHLSLWDFGARDVDQRPSLGIVPLGMISPVVARCKNKVFSMSLKLL